MAGAVAARAWRTTVPEEIETELAALWREVGSGDTRVARAVMSNLVVFRDRIAPAAADPATVAAGLPLDDVAARHPSRMIVVEHCHDDTPAPPFAAGVRVVTFGPPNARYGVEQIVVRAACPDASLLSILRRFVRGDLPTSVWWTEDLSAAPPLEPFIRVGRQLLYDSRNWRDVRRGVAAVIAVADGDGIDVADLNWRRLAPMRRALVHARGPLNSEAWQRAAVQIAPAAGEEALGWLCAGWLRSARRAHRSSVTVQPASPARDAEHLLTVTVERFTATLTTSLCNVAGAGSPLIVPSPAESGADAVAAELRMLARDPALLATVHAIADDAGRL